MKKSLILLIGLCFTAAANAQNNDFLTDYSLLETRQGDFADRVYIAEGAAEKLENYSGIMVDQPEIFIAADSKYKGAKGDQLKLLADTIRLAMMERLEAGGYAVSEEPGEGVLYLRLAAVDLYLKKKKRGFLSYTPIGAVVHASKQAAVKDLWKKIDIVELGLEVEVTDSVTGEIIGAGTSSHGMRKGEGQEQDPVSWEELDAVMSTAGERVRCQLDNARLEEGARQDCTAIFVAPAPADD